MNIQQAITANRNRQAKYKKALSLIHKIQLRIFDYEMMGKRAKALRIIALCQKILVPYWKAQSLAREIRRKPLTTA